MPKPYYIHSANGQTSLVELCDKDGNVLAQILPQGKPVHRQIVIDLLRYLVDTLETVEEMTPVQIRADHAVSEFINHCGCSFAPKHVELIKECPLHDVPFIATDQGGTCSAGVEIV